MNATSSLQRVRRSLRRYVADKPLFYMPFARMFSVGTPVERDTELVIEGYPRSGNSFAEAAFQVAQTSPVKLAHHCHAAAQVLQAVRWNIPVLVVLRDPLEACRSLIMHHPQAYDAKLALSEYLDFHRGILPVRPYAVVARFETVIEDFGLVTDAINKKYSTRFTRFLHDKENESRAFSLLDRLSRERGTADEAEPYTPGKDAATVQARERQKQHVKQSFQADDVQEQLSQARTIYAQLSAAADV
jgi:hypothetical protein